MSDDAEAAFARLAQRFGDEPGVTAGTGFGTAPGLRVGGKIFAMLPHGELVVKLPAARCDELLGAGAARAFAVGKRTMRKWVVVDGLDDERWAVLAREALTHVSG